MNAFAALLLLALSVKHDATPLRNGCTKDSQAIATVPAHAAVTIRFALAGQADPCYRVAVAIDGKTVQGYLPESAIDGLANFDKARRDAPWVQPPPQATPESTASLPANKAAGANAIRLLQAGEPQAALDALEPELSKRKDPALLDLAGLAAWRADDGRDALDYWRESLDLRPDPKIELLYHRVERETKGDHSTEKLAGMRIMLRYDGATVSVDTARQMLGLLDQDIIRASAELGCSVGQRILAIVQSREAYRQSVDAAEWTTGLYDGRIRVPVLQGERVDAAVRRVFAHETVHACLATMGQWPPWLQEGLAQKLSGDVLTPALNKKIAGMLAAKKLPRLEHLAQDWSRLDLEHATVSYALALKAADLLWEDYRQLGIGNLLRNPDRLPAVTADLDRRLGL